MTDTAPKPRLRFSDAAGRAGIGVQVANRRPTRGVLRKPRRIAK